MTAPALRSISRARLRHRRRRPAVAGRPLGRRRDQPSAAPAGGAAQYAYYAGIPWAGIELFVAERSFAGVFPTHDGAGVHLGLHSLR